MDEMQDKPMDQSAEEMGGGSQASAGAPDQQGGVGPEVRRVGPVRAIPEPSGLVPTADERTIAALAHASTLLNLITGFLGVIVAGVIWLSYRDRSRYVAFQALQSAVFQLAVLIVVAIGATITVIAWTITGVLTAILIGLCLMPIALILTLIVIAIPLAAIAYQLYAAVQTYQGRDFSYWWVGPFVRQQGWA